MYVCLPMSTSDPLSSSGSQKSSSTLQPTSFPRQSASECVWMEIERLIYGWGEHVNHSLQGDVITRSVSPDHHERSYRLLNTVVVFQHSNNFRPAGRDRP